MEFEEFEEGFVVKVAVDGGRFGVAVRIGRIELNISLGSSLLDSSVIIPNKGESHLFWLLGVSNLKIKSSN